MQTYEQYEKQLEEVAQIHDSEFELFEPEKIVLPYGIGMDTSSKFIQVYVLLTTPSNMELLS